MKCLSQDLEIQELPRLRRKLIPTRGSRRIAVLTPPLCGHQEETFLEARSSEFVFWPQPGSTAVKTLISLSPWAHPFQLQNKACSLCTKCDTAAWSYPWCPPDPEIQRRAKPLPGRGFLPEPSTALVGGSSVPKAAHPRHGRATVI